MKIEHGKSTDFGTCGGCLVNVTISGAIRKHAVRRVVLRDMSALVLCDPCAGKLAKQLTKKPKVTQKKLRRALEGGCEK